MKRIGFITDDIHFQEPITKVLHDFNSQEEFYVETINRLNPEFSALTKIISLIQMCDVLVFYIRRGTANIYYEIGLAQGGGASTVIVSSSHELIPFELSHQKIIINNSGDFEIISYELFCMLEQASTSSYKSPLKYSDANVVPLPKEYFSGFKYRDLYAFDGASRHKLFEDWFFELSTNVAQWDVMQSESLISGVFFDFLIWNSVGDAELNLLGNPIPVLLKSTNSMNFSEWSLLAGKIKKQGLRSLILLTTAKNRIDSYSFSNKIRKQHGIMLISLDRDDLIDIETPKDLYLSIKKELLNIVYRGEGV